MTYRPVKESEIPLPMYGDRSLVERLLWENNLLLRELIDLFKGIQAAAQSEPCMCGGSGNCVC